MTAVDARLKALNILTKLLQDKTSLSISFGSSADIPAATKELCFGVCRNYFRLEAIASALVKKKPKEFDVWVALLLGLYQLHVLNKPDYAIVKETVALLDKVKKSWAKGLVNAVLRNYCRQKEELIKTLSKQSAYRYNHPEWFVKKMKHDWPLQWEAILQANDEHPPMTLRVNTSKTNRDDYLQALTQVGLSAQKHPVATEAMILEHPCDVTSLPGFHQGLVSVQDAAAQLAVSLLNLKSNLSVLDACCAPGGKTGHILESEAHLTSCVALDIDARRMKRVHENLTRLGVHAIQKVGDILHPEAWWDGVLFDRILLDAPCSATGVIRRHPDIKLLRSLEEIKIAATLQSAILDRTWSYLASGGVLVYATCSINPEENDRQIAAFISRQKDAEIIPIAADWGVKTDCGRQILPGFEGMDGFYYSVLCKNGTK